MVFGITTSLDVPLAVYWQTYAPLSAIAFGLCINCYSRFVDFDSMHQVRKDDDTKWRKVKREVIVHRAAH